MCFIRLTRPCRMSHLVTKPKKWYVRPAKTQISLGICPVWSESSLCAQCVVKDPSFLHADSEAAKTLIRLGGCPGWSESSLGAHAILLVLSWCGSYYVHVSKFAHAIVCFIRLIRPWKIWIPESWHFNTTKTVKNWNHNFEVASSDAIH